jgi:ribosomal protein S18 acetylase RimI-like enzyme
MIRPATLADLDALLAIEMRCFDGQDRFSRRSFRYLLTKANAITLVTEIEQVLEGYVSVLFNTGTSLARIYSLAVRPESRGKGLGEALMEAAEAAAIARGFVTLRLEVHPDNASAIALYRQHGYKQFGITGPDYYADHAPALRFEKRLAPPFKPELVHVDYYQQTLEFTCGPAALMMAMHALEPAVEFTRSLELQLWRESTTIFMTSGHGGCGPYGMALALDRRGFRIELYVSEEGTFFRDSVRSEEKKAVMQLVEEDFVAEIQAQAIPVIHGKLTVEKLQERFVAGGIPVVLISSYRIYREKSPHWVVVTGFDDQYIYVHDPYVDEKAGKRAIDCINMPIPKKDFQRMTSYGKAAQKAALIVYRDH